MIDAVKNGEGLFLNNLAAQLDVVYSQVPRDYRRWMKTQNILMPMHIFLQQTYSRSDLDGTRPLDKILPMLSTSGLANRTYVSSTRIEDMSDTGGPRYHQFRYGGEGVDTETGSRFPASRNTARAKTRCGTGMATLLTVLSGVSVR